MYGFVVALMAVAGPTLSQPTLVDEMGPLLRVPSADTGLLFKTQPVVVDGKVLVPQAAIDRWLRVKADRPAKSELAYTYLGGTQSAIRIHLWVDEKRARVAQAEVPLEAAPRVIDGTLYLPLKFMAEAFGVWVEHQGRLILLRKPDLDWACTLAIPPHPKSLEGKMTALAVARRPEKLKRVELVALSPDALSGYVVVAELSGDGQSTIRYATRYTRDATGWHFAGESLIVAPPHTGD